ncbi:hypothetical protein BD410DRAFT_782441 [Rickenella mellea]|uniref:Pali-domain-containing protein n=1 Tax=Rickenella mellea TaxID=50990 RepID=A0A4Y7QKI7_9AGAM|nr:hypothetical protein BD410DRAFT_782441 [Rickenella mellea]
MAFKFSWLNHALPAATPILTSVVFALLMAATLSSPIDDRAYLFAVTPRNSASGYHLGVFGWCNDKGKNCSSRKVSYTINGVMPDSFAVGCLLLHPITTACAFFALVFSLLAIGMHKVSQISLFLCFFVTVLAAETLIVDFLILSYFSEGSQANHGPGVNMVICAFILQALALLSSVICAFVGHSKRRT